MSSPSPILGDVIQLLQSGALDSALPAAALTAAQATRAQGGYVAIGADVTITPANAAAYNGKVAVLDAARTVTLSPGLGFFSLRVMTPATGNASIARSAAPVTLNGAATTLTRARAQQRTFDIFTTADDAFEVTGS